jgi:RNA-directed DNA polymerase
MDLQTPERLRTLQGKLYQKATDEPEFRFYSLFDKVCWDETLTHAFRRVRCNGAAPGVDGVTLRPSKR